MHLNIRLDSQVVQIRLEDAASTRDLCTMLPLPLVFNDLLAREKFAHLPRPLANDSERISRYGAGDVVYWPPGPDISIYYGPEERCISDGVIRLGRVMGAIDGLRPVHPMHAMMNWAHRIADIGTHEPDR